MKEKVLVYVGPSVDKDKARSILPEAIFLPPIRHADLVSHIPQYMPTHVLILDGCFNESLPPWHKEISWAILKGIKVYGAASMGALRASELADYGMIGCGKIFEWYYEGVIDADDEVAVIYHVTPKGQYVCETTALVDYRAGLLDAVESGILSEEEAKEKFEIEQSKHYTCRFASQFSVQQKEADAIQLLTEFRDLVPLTDNRPTLDFITPLFRGMLDRERRVEFKGAQITLQNLDSYISLHSPSHHQIRWDAQNRMLALILADVLQVKASAEEIEEEWVNFCARHHLTTWDSFLDWLKANLLSKENFDVITIQNARIRKLQKAHVTSSMFGRQTSTILDYLRSHNQLQFFVDDCADTERRIVDHDNSESVSMDLSITLEQLLVDHFDATGLEISGSLTDFVRDTGIGNLEELRVVLSRFTLARQ